MCYNESMEKECKIHGLTHYYKSHCRKCHVANVRKTRRRVRKKLVEVAGSECIRCGYSKSIRALSFHHRDPKEKLFSVSEHGKSLKKCLEEIKKCDLICANCHMEEEEKKLIEKFGDDY